MRLLRKVLAAALYLAGAVAVLFVAYKYHECHETFVHDMDIWRYFPWWGIGVALVVAAALLWPKQGGPV